MPSNRFEEYAQNLLGLKRLVETNLDKIKKARIKIVLLDDPKKLADFDKFLKAAEVLVQKKPLEESDSSALENIKSFFDERQGESQFDSLQHAIGNRVDNLAVELLYFIQGAVFELAPELESVANRDARQSDIANLSSENTISGENPENDDELRRRFEALKLTDVETPLGSRISTESDEKQGKMVPPENDTLLAVATKILGDKDDFDGPSFPRGSFDPEILPANFSQFFDKLWSDDFVPAGQAAVEKSDLLDEPVWRPETTEEWFARVMRDLGPVMSQKISGVNENRISDIIAILNEGLKIDGLEITKKRVWIQDMIVELGMHTDLSVLKFYDKINESSISDEKINMLFEGLKEKLKVELHPTIAFRESKIQQKSVGFADDKNLSNVSSPSNEEFEVEPLWKMFETDPSDTATQDTPVATTPLATNSSNITPPPIPLTDPTHIETQALSSIPAVAPTTIPAAQELSNQTVSEFFDEFWHDDLMPVGKNAVDLKAFQETLKNGGLNVLLELRDFIELRDFMRKDVENNPTIPEKVLLDELYAAFEELKNSHIPPDETLSKKILDLLHKTMPDGENHFDCIVDISFDGGSEKQEILKAISKIAKTILPQYANVPVQTLESPSVLSGALNVSPNELEAQRLSTLEESFDSLGQTGGTLPLPLNELAGMLASGLLTPRSEEKSTLEEEPSVLTLPSSQPTRQTPLTITLGPLPSVEPPELIQFAATKRQEGNPVRLTIKPILASDSLPGKPRVLPQEPPALPPGTPKAPITFMHDYSANINRLAKIERKKGMALTAENIAAHVEKVVNKVNDMHELSLIKNENEEEFSAKLLEQKKKSPEKLKKWNDRSLGEQAEHLKFKKITAALHENLEATAIKELGSVVGFEIERKNGEETELCMREIFDKGTGLTTIDVFTQEDDDLLSITHKLPSAWRLDHTIYSQ